MESITDRFLVFYNYLVQEKKIRSAHDFSQRVSISNSLLTEIKKGRSKVGLKIIQNTVNNFPKINATWLLTGKDQMLVSQGEALKKIEDPEIIKKEDEGFKIQLNYCQEVSKSKEKIIELLEETLKMKEEKLKSLTSENEKLINLLIKCREKKDYVTKQE